MLREISRVIDDAESFFLTSHLNPDGDAIGSILAFKGILNKLGHDPVLYMEDPVPENFKFLPGSDKIIHHMNGISGRTFDLAIVVDSTDWMRTGGPFEPEVNFRKVINIDHHKSNTNFGDINLVKTEASATSEIIYDLLNVMGLPLSLEVATCIYAGIMTDTGSFTYSNTNDRAFGISEKLVKVGVVPDAIAEEVNENYSVSRLLLLKMALDTLEFSADKRIGAMTISQEMFKKTDSGPHIIEGFIDYPRFVSGVKVAILFRELSGGGKYKVSFRSRNPLDVSRIAGAFGGGGHMNASGCTVEGNLLDVKAEVFKVVEAELKKKRRNEEKRGS
ncbi:MAG: bifunctional oligoribonuclease/PAP phosphatase NrnA [Deltaproteobacteria bacterium]|uniref:Bifunctional oligoribonuclease/PAP phosphatase NrnA n=1 Tax=Candidatus Zymogenus saltonus TaxID=2844893 RepID=A0A9D8PP42_9DELT|nr:bifunctional oligoribonuclease/PAP phosphatase NrnA [Candidatus Zymogenus saltonus]